MLAFGRTLIYVVEIEIEIEIEITSRRILTSFQNWVLLESTFLATTLQRSVSSWFYNNASTWTVPLCVSSFHRHNLFFGLPMTNHCKKALRATSCLSSTRSFIPTCNCILATLYALCWYGLMFTFFNTCTLLSCDIQLCRSCDSQYNFAHSIMKA